MSREPRPWQSEKKIAGSSITIFANFHTTRYTFGNREGKTVHS